MKTEFLGTCDSDSRFFCVGGKDLYQYRWNSTGRCVTVLHPDTKRTFTLSVYTVELDGETYSFASGAFPGGKTAFYEISDEQLMISIYKKHKNGQGFLSVFML